MGKQTSHDATSPLGVAVGLAAAPAAQPAASVKARQQTLRSCDNSTLRKHILKVETRNLWKYQQRTTLPLPWADLATLHSFRRCMASVSTRSSDFLKRRDLWFEYSNMSRHHVRTITWRPQQPSPTFNEYHRGGGLECNSGSNGALSDSELERPTRKQREWLWASRDAFHPTPSAHTQDADDILVLRRALHGASILMLGDSLTRQQFYSLICLLISYGVAPTRVTFPECRSSCAILLKDEPAIRKQLRSHDIVLAEGASHHLDKMGGNDQFFNVLESLLRFISQQIKSTARPAWLRTGIWLRTRCPRHFNMRQPHPTGKQCHNVTAPPKALQYSDLADYDRTPLQNCALHASLAGLNIRILETEALSFHRADQHPLGPSLEARGACDLSHWCAAGSGPSVPDTWNLLWLKQLTLMYLSGHTK